jgi:hypothetical protein
MERRITSLIIHYGNDEEAWKDGKIFGSSLAALKKSEPEKYEMFIRGGHEEWFETFQRHEKNWPHPGKYLLELSKVYPNFPIKWLPKLNYIIMYVPEDLVDSVIKNIKKITPYVQQ